MTTSTIDQELRATRFCTLLHLPPHVQAQAQDVATAEDRRNAPAEGEDGPEIAFDRRRLWKSGRLLRVKFLGGSAHVRDRVEHHALAWVRAGANLHLEFVSQGAAELRIAFRDDGSWSRLGTDALLIPDGEPTMNFGWFKDSTPEDEFERTVVHEFGHALGAIHEHQHPAGGIPWDRQRVYAYYAATQGR